MRLSNDLIRKLYRLHTFAGLIVAAHFAVFALTGLPLLFKEELTGASRSRFFRTTTTLPCSTRGSASAATRACAARAGQVTP